jgi:hypothetical protein
MSLCPLSFLVITFWLQKTGSTITLSWDAMTLSITIRKCDTQYNDAQRLDMKSSH